MHIEPYICTDFDSNEFIYRSNKGKPEVTFNKDTPKYFYKYYKVTEFTDSILRGNLFFSHPFQFNDIVDSSTLLWDLRNYKFEDYINILPKGFEDNFSEEYSYDKKNGFNELASILKHRFIPSCIYDKKHWSKIISYERHQKSEFAHIGLFLMKMFSLKWGVHCLTEYCDNNLLWAHYTEDRGYCIEYKSQELLQSLKSNSNQNIIYFPVNYQSKLDRIDFPRYISKEGNRYDVNIPFMYLFSIKYKDWSYEKEWRVLIQKENMGYFPNPIEFGTQSDNLNSRLTSINENSINRIILGTYFFSNELFDTCEAANGNFRYTFKLFRCEDDTVKMKVKNCLSFLRILQANFSDKIYQIEHFVNPTKNTLERKVSFKIEILSLDDNSVVVNRIPCN